MKIVTGYPPLIDKIDAKFKVRGKSVIFSWGDTIYNPSGGHIPPELIAHEAAHGNRQGDDVEGWWDRYIESDEFRLQEEVAAHMAELLHVMGPNPGRNMRRQAIRTTAKRLCNKIYQYDISQARAVEILSRIERHVRDQ